MDNQATGGRSPMNPLQAPFTRLPPIDPKGTFHIRCLPTFQNLSLLRALPAKSRYFVDILCDLLLRRGRPRVRAEGVRAARGRPEEGARQHQELPGKPEVKKRMELPLS